MTIGFGVPADQNPQHGMQLEARILSTEGLARIDRSGRPQPQLAERWSVSPDGLSWLIQLRAGAVFHDGTPVRAAGIADILRRELPALLASAGSDVASVTAENDREIRVQLRAPSAFVPEGLEATIQDAKSPLKSTGSFQVVSSTPETIDLTAHSRYYLGSPSISRVTIKPYANLRAAWADLMRGGADVLYDVDPDALDLLRPASTWRVFEFTQHYAFVLIVNVRQDMWRDKAVRRALNAAIDRDKLVADAFGGHATPATGPVWPNHWAYDPSLPHFAYDPTVASQLLGERRAHGSGGKGALPPLRFRCLFPDAVPERLALILQQQLQGFGVEMVPEVASLADFNQRFTTGQFDAVLLPALLAPNLLRTYRWWHSGAPFNFGAFASAAVDESLDLVRHAPDDAVYKAGVAAFQRAIVDDPPAIFLAWSHRALVVSRKYDVGADPSGDVLKTLHAWRVAGDERRVARN